MHATAATTLSACLLMLAGLSAAATAASAQQGMRFSHHDWEIACDNTRTCRAAGYQSEAQDDADDVLPVSVLFTRKAGAGAPVQAQLQLGEVEDEKEGPGELAMRIDGKPAGKLSIDKDGMFPLSAQQTTRLLAALTRQTNIAWTDGKRTWKLSDKGAAAVLLKMDEFQGRLGTPGALARKGTKDESGVLPPLPAPVIQAAAVADDRPIRLSKAELKNLRAAVQPSTEECALPEDRQDELTVRRLSAAKLLVSTACWMGAYNSASAYWVVNAKPPYAPELVTHDGSDYSDGSISVSHKGRGIGDCWSFGEYTWDGRRFVHTSQGTTGLCKSVAAGGAWSLPVLVTTLRPQPKAGVRSDIQTRSQP